VLKPDAAQRPYTVTELANEIKRELRPLTALLVKGEVSGMKRGAKGHYSFAIRDNLSLINGFLYADDARRVTTLPEDGQVFIFRGRVDFWTQYGALRFIVDQIEFDDIGKLRARLEELKRRLEAEGAFAPERKRRLPFLPRAVALLTSPTGAVIHDLQETILDRYPNMTITVYPALARGETAAGRRDRAACEPRDGADRPQEAAPAPGPPRPGPAPHGEADPSGGRAGSPEPGRPGSPPRRGPPRPATPAGQRRRLAPG